MANLNRISDGESRLHFWRHILAAITHELSPTCFGDSSVLQQSPVMSRILSIEADALAFDL